MSVFPFNWSRVIAFVLHRACKRKFFGGDVTVCDSVLHLLEWVRRVTIGRLRLGLELLCAPLVEHLIPLADALSTLLLLFFASLLRYQGSHLFYLCLQAGLLPQTLAAELASSPTQVQNAFEQTSFAALFC